MGHQANSPNDFDGGVFGIGFGIGGLDDDGSSPQSAYRKFAGADDVLIDKDQWVAGVIIEESGLRLRFEGFYENKTDGIHSERESAFRGARRSAGGVPTGERGSCHEPPKNYIWLGFFGAGRVFMRYFGACGSLTHCRHSGGRFIRFQGTSQLV